jgi:hypothetical protein
LLWPAKRASVPIAIVRLILSAYDQSEASSQLAGETLEELLDNVPNAREELVVVERRLEQLRADIAKSQKREDGSSKAKLED